MNRNEIKTLLKRRGSLLELQQKMSSDSNDDTNSPITNGIYRDTCTTIGRTIYNIDKQLLRYCKESVVGRWLLQIKGMTPDVAAGLLAYFNIKGKRYAAQFIKYSGSDDSKYPHNNDIRSIMNKLIRNLKSDSESLYNHLWQSKYLDLLNGGETDDTSHIRADRYIRKVFISHLFEEMYLEEHDGQLPERYNDSECVIIEPEVPYTKNR